MTKGRVCILVMDSFGIGASLDADQYHDSGADTFGHIYQACEQGLANKKGLREGPLKIPHLADLGIYHAALASTGVPLLDLKSLAKPRGYFGYAVEQSVGKDTPSGHWEMAGVPVFTHWGYFPDTPFCFPKDLIAQLILETKLPGVLGEKHASGTAILEELGEEHCQTGKPIVYTSADSVFQIAAHEETFGLERLYEVCGVARKLVTDYNIGRVIARPFVGTKGHFKRSAHRIDYALPPPELTLLDVLKEAGNEVIAIGKIADIFAHQGISQTIKADGNMALFDATLESLKTAPEGSLIFSNFVDFDSSYGHRRDIIGYAAALETFDRRIPELLHALGPEDLVVITADHGCDPSFPGSDHTREHVPVLAFGKRVKPQFIGRRDSFADIGQSIADYLGLRKLKHGISFI